MQLYDQQLDAKTRRKLKDERRMRFRRAIERYEDRCRLQAELEDFAELSAFSALQVAARRNARPAH
ncbi:PA3496 family putative envelope integrity protein [Stutzerimonas tarimensis]|uniref:PA3496 family putative envelope integrity protein n=1 Tax=Stutzerimonas tarimensis TaxID=1507735 RepID=A0ABV7TAU2_9GAMM